MQQNINLEKNVLIEFTPEWIIFVLALLQKQPYEQVVDLINSMREQIVKQHTKAKEVTIENGIQATT